MNPDPRDIVGRSHNQRLQFLGDLFVDKLIFESPTPEGIEINALDRRDVLSYGLDLDPSQKRHCFYHQGCPTRTEAVGFFEVVQTTDSEISRQFFHMDCAKKLAYKIIGEENP